MSITEQGEGHGDTAAHNETTPATTNTTSLGDPSPQQPDNPDDHTSPQPTPSSSTSRGPDAKADHFLDRIKVYLKRPLDSTGQSRRWISPATLSSERASAQAISAGAQACPLARTPAFAPQAGAAALCATEVSRAPQGGVPHGGISDCKVGGCWGTQP